MVKRKRVSESLRDVELRLVAELMKNSRRSDRELAKVIGVSQPTVGRLISRLEKDGVIKEFTIIPDFSKLGYEIMGVTSIGVRDEAVAGGFKEIRRMTTEVEKKNPHASLMAVNGTNHSKNKLFISFYENYSAFASAMQLTRQLPFVSIDSMETFLVDLTDETNYRLLTMSAIAEHLLKKSQEQTRGGANGE